MSPLNITQPLGIWSIMATIRWCPIYPKWDSYQPLKFTLSVEFIGPNLFFSSILVSFFVPCCLFGSRNQLQCWKDGCSHRSINQSWRDEVWAQTAQTTYPREGKVYRKPSKIYEPPVFSKKKHMVSMVSCKKLGCTNPMVSCSFLNRRGWRPLSEKFKTFQFKVVSRHFSYNHL